jgi:HEAT repeat protein
VIAVHTFDPKTFFFLEYPIGLHEFDFPEIFGYGSTPDILEFVNLAARLNLLIHDKDALMVHFVHLMLRDTLAYTFSLSHLQDSDMYDEFNTTNPALTLGILEDVRAVTPLIEALENLPWHIHETILWALERIAVAHPIVDAILALRAAEDIAIRHEAIAFLGQLRDPVAIDHLMVALEDEDWRIRNGAINMLRRFNDTRSIQPLTQLLSDYTIVEPLFGTRICDVAAEALEEIGTAEALVAVAAWREKDAGR